MQPEIIDAPALMKRITRERRRDGGKRAAETRRQQRPEYVLANKMRCVIQANPEPTVAPASVIYFVECGAYVKVGYTKEALLRTRMSGMISENPYDLTLIGTVDGGYRAEVKLHELMEEWRHKREWFHLTPLVRSAIRVLTGVQ
jgi:hypothetical protein